MAAVWGRFGINTFAIALSLLLSLWVFLANGGATFYVDTIDYLERGHQMLSILGLDPAPLREPHAASAMVTPDGPAETVETVDGSRSMVFSLLLGVFFWIGAVDGLVVMNAALGVGIVWLACRLSVRGLAHAPPPSVLCLAAVGLAAIGSLPFYIAFLMPDMLAPVLLMSAALLAAYAPRMQVWELCIVTALGCLAITVSISHLAIGMILTPVVLLTAVLIPGPRRWLGPALFLTVLLAGVSEQIALRLAAKEVENAEIIYRPFLTARLIQDGPGYTYLSDRCPMDAEPTCALLNALSVSDDPARFSAANISFSDSPEAGSFLLMSSDDRRRVAQHQFRFFLYVLLDRPVETSWAIIANTYRQLTLNSPDMTLQADWMVKRGAGVTGMAWGAFAAGRLTENTSWLAIANPAQAALYLLSAICALGVLLVGRAPPAAAAFLMVILLGVLANAFVCGVLSQPANRYGARVIWLLPVIAVIGCAVLAAYRREKRSDASNRITAE